MDEAKELGQAEATRRGVPFFEDGAEPAQYEGYAAIGDEILDQLGETPAAVVVPVGNGALLGGIGRAVKARSPETLRVGVVAAAAPVMADSWEAGRAVPSEESATFADGLAVRVAIPYAVDVLNEVATHMLRVSEAEIAGGVLAYADAGIRAEGAAGAALAAMPQLPELDGPVVLDRHRPQHRRRPARSSPGPVRKIGRSGHTFPANGPGTTRRAPQLGPAALARRVEHRPAGVRPGDPPARRRGREAHGTRLRPTNRRTSRASRSSSRDHRRAGGRTASAASAGWPSPWPSSAR